MERRLKRLWKLQIWLVVQAACGIDGMCLDSDGNIIGTAGNWASGPGPMIYVWTPTGRVLETTLSVLQLEVYYRYLPTFDIMKMDRHNLVGDREADDDGVELIIE